MENIIIIGKREKAYLGKTTYFFYFFLSIILFFFSSIFFSFLFIGRKNAPYILGFILGMLSFIILGVIFLILGIYRVKISRNNNDCSEECLIYDEKKEVFIFYNIYTKEKIEVEPSNIKRMYGSKLGTNNELHIAYETKNGVKKVNLGFCSNIDQESFNKELIKVINPEDVGM